MGVLYALESIRTPALDKIMSVITLLGGELFFMVIAVTVFWCVSKREGYYLMIVGFFGTVINQFLKILCCVPRPWIKDPDFTIVESARAEATGIPSPAVTHRTPWPPMAASPGIFAAAGCGWCWSC